MTVTVLDRPTPPEGLMVTPPPEDKKDAMELLWKRSRDDGGAPIEYYQVLQDIVHMQGHSDYLST